MSESKSSQSSEAFLLCVKSIRAQKLFANDVMGGETGGKKKNNHRNMRCYQQLQLYLT